MILLHEEDWKINKKGRMVDVYIFTTVVSEQAGRQAIVEIW